MLKVNINKHIYKLFLGVTKYTPTILALTQIIGLVLNYFGIKSDLISCFGGVSIIFIILLFIMSYVFKFCYIFRIPLYYMIIITIINIMDYIIVFPITTLILFRLHTIIIGIFLLAFVYCMYKNRNKPKIDYIKQFCERYNCNCE